MLKFWSKLLLILLIIFFAQLVAAHYLGTSTVPEISLLKKYLQDKYDLIYLGDSVIKSAPDDEADKASISEILAKIRPELKIGDLTRGAYNPTIYETLLSYISRSPYRPKAVIIAINLRSFSPEWDRRPEYQFEKEKLFLSSSIPFFASFFKPLAVFRAINVTTVTYEDWFNTPVYNGLLKVGTVQDFENQKKFNLINEDNIRAKYIYEYLYSLDSEQRELKSLEKTIALAKAAGIQVYVYLTPIDYQEGKKYLGDDFIKQTSANANLICSVIKEQGLPCLNLAFSLDSSYFNHPAYPNEHLKSEGRKFVAEHINNFFLKK
jgi:hypothetical protein